VKKRTFKLDFIRWVLVGLIVMCVFSGAGIFWHSTELQPAFEKLQAQRQSREN
jgi:hypothetical protein